MQLDGRVAVVTGGSSGNDDIVGAVEAAETFGGVDAYGMNRPRSARWPLQR